MNRVFSNLKCDSAFLAVSTLYHGWKCLETFGKGSLRAWQKKSCHMTVTQLLSFQNKGQTTVNFDHELKWNYFSFWSWLFVNIHRLWTLNMIRLWTLKVNKGERLWVVEQKTNSNDRTLTVSLKQTSNRSSSWYIKKFSR